MHARSTHREETPGREHVRRIRERFSVREWIRWRDLGGKVTAVILDRIHAFEAAERAAAEAPVAVPSSRRARQPLPGKPLVLVRGCIRVRCLSQTAAAERLRIPRTTLWSAMAAGRPVNGWTPRRAA